MADALAPLRLCDRLALDVRGVAETLSISERTVRDLLSMPDFPFVRIGRRVLVPVRELREWLSDEVRREQITAQQDVDELLGEG